MFASLKILAEQAAWAEEEAMKRDLIPPEWYKADRLAPCAPRKVKVTLRLNEELVKWFRHLGTGWHGRAELVLMAYIKAVLAGELEE